MIWIVWGKDFSTGPSYASWKVFSLGRISWYWHRQLAKTFLRGKPNTFTSLRDLQSTQGCRKVWKSGGHNLLPLVKIRLTNLPKPGEEGVCAPMPHCPPPPSNIPATHAMHLTWHLTEVALPKDWFVLALKQDYQLMDKKWHPCKK